MKNMMNSFLHLCRISSMGECPRIYISCREAATGDVNPNLMPLKKEIGNISEFYLILFNLPRRNRYCL